MMLYLAQIEKKGRPRDFKLKLVAMCRADGLWVKTNDTLALPSEHHSFNDGILVLTDLDEKRQILQLTNAANELVRILEDLSQRCSKIDKQESEIKLWRTSLDYQSRELAQRAASLDVAEEDLRGKSANLQRIAGNVSKAKTELDRLAAALAEDREKLERDRAALQGAWEHLRYEQEQLKSQSDRDTN